MMEPAELAALAAEKHVVVVGGGVGGLIAARECAKVGMRVTVLEASDAVGGAIRRAELDGVAVDAGAESFATRGGHVRALLTELGLADRIVAPAPGGAWLAGIPGIGAAPLPVGGILGIPANPFQDDVRRIIGWSGAWRAYLDRVRPPLTIGHERSLGKLVASRMGAKVRDRLVAPVTTGVYSASPADVDVDVAAPGLNSALTRVGSLGGAVQALRDESAARARAARSTAAPADAAPTDAPPADAAPAEPKAPGAAVEGLDGGMSVLVDALLADLATFDVEVRTGVPVESVRRIGDRWLVTAPALPSEEPTAELAEPETDGDPALPQEWESDAVIVAVDERTARTLLAPVVPALAESGEVTAPEIEIITLLLDAPALDAAPRGTGVLTVPGTHVAKALTHSTAKWGWLRAAAGSRHVVRVSFGAQGEEPATAAMDDDEAFGLAVREASDLLGVPLFSHDVVAAHRARHVQAQPASIVGSGERREAARAAVQSVPGLAAVGAWLAGTGLAQVIPDATEETDRLRRALLWK
jgi:oxygen-dependent protoporphyrinogen oxidase